MTPVEFFAGSGAVAWAYLAWRLVRGLRSLGLHARSLSKRVRWALFGPSTRRRRSSA